VTAYLELIRHPRMAALLTAALVARMPIGINGLAIVLFLRAETGSFSLAGAVAGGLALGIGLPTAGALYERFTGDAFHFMAIPALAGLLLALWLRARSHRLGDP
jgi:hypothetical protein